MCEDENYIVIDADTIPLNEIKFIDNDKINHFLIDNDNFLNHWLHAWHICCFTMKMKISTQNQHYIP